MIKILKSHPQVGENIKENLYISKNQNKQVKYVEITIKNQTNKKTKSLIMVGIILAMTWTRQIILY